MWEDIKKIGSLAIDQTKGQKDLLLTNLKIKSYSDKRDIAFTKLGELLYPVVRDGLEENINLSDEKIKEAVKDISDVEDEIKKTQEHLLNLKSVLAGEIEIISSGVGTVWEKTKSAITGTEIEKSDALLKPLPDDTQAEDKKAN